jgi:hypothetical protein
LLNQVSEIKRLRVIGTRNFPDKGIRAGMGFKWNRGRVPSPELLMPSVIWVLSFNLNEEDSQSSSAMVVPNVQSPFQVSFFVSLAWRSLTA